MQYAFILYTQHQHTYMYELQPLLKAAHSFTSFFRQMVLYTFFVQSFKTFFRAFHVFQPNFFSFRSLLSICMRTGFHITTTTRLKRPTTYFGVTTNCNNSCYSYVCVCAANCFQHDLPFASLTHTHTRNLHVHVHICKQIAAQLY